MVGSAVNPVASGLMQFAAALSVHPVAATAVGEVVGEILEHIGTDVDVLLVFATPAHTGALEDIVPALQQLLNPKAMAGCISEGIIGPEQAVIDSPGLVVWACRGAQAWVSSLKMLDESARDELINAAGTDGSAFIFADYRSFSVDDLFAEIEILDNHIQIAGGYALGASQLPGTLIMNGQLVKGGAVAIVIKPECTLRTLVAHGARPIGSPLAVTRSDGRVVYELAGVAALVKLTQMLETELTDEDVDLAGEGLLIGRVLDERQDQFGIGDFAVSPLTDSDPMSATITVSEALPVGTIVQFHVPDERSANTVLAKALLNQKANAGLIFASGERSSTLFALPDNDALAMADLLGNPVVAGFMTSAEFGPAAGTNVVNGLSAVMTLFSN